MQTAVAIKSEEETIGALVESVIVKGDLAKLTAEERTNYYLAVCKGIGLNPLTRPLEFLTLNGKLVLYAKRDAADQLRKINGVSIEILSQKISDGILTVHVRAKDRTGRTDEDLGVVQVGRAQGDMLANIILKGITKAKRRVTLSICGLGMLDETELETIPDAAKGFERREPAELDVTPQEPIDEIPDSETMIATSLVNKIGDVKDEAALTAFTLSDDFKAAYADLGPKEKARVQAAGMMRRKALKA